MTTQEHVIEIAEDGVVQAMHIDKFDLGFLGRQTVRRASEIMFDEETQTWAIHRVDHEASPVPKVEAPAPEACGFTSYEEARAVEVRWFNAARKEGVCPTSMRGVEILRQVK